MEVGLLRTFLVAANRENFRETAEIRHISQPTVSVQIRQLEEELGATLFFRHGRTVSLTPAGSFLAREAERIVRAHDEAVQRFHTWNQGRTQELTLGVSPLVAASVLPRIISRFAENSPGIDIGVQVMESEDIEPAIAGGRVDAGLGRLPAREREVMDRWLYDDPVVCVIPPDGGDPDAAAPDLADLLRRLRILTHNHPGYWDDLLSLLQSQVGPARTMVVSQVHVTKRFIEEGLGLSFLPASSVYREFMEGRLAKLHVPGLRLPTAKTYFLSGRLPSPAAERFLNHLESLRDTF